MRRSRIASHSIAAGAAAWIAVAFVLHRDFGTTWDDPFHAEVGRLALDYFRSFGADFAVDGFINAYLYGPLHDLVPAMLSAEDGPALYDTRHLWNALFAALAFPGLLWLCRGIASPWLPALAALALFAQPRFFGDAFLNSTDAPLAIAVILFHAALFALVRRPVARWRDVLTVGAALGLVAIERASGFPLFVVETLVALAVRDFLHRGSPAHAAERIVVQLAAAFALAWIVMILPWPSAHRSPLVAPIRAMAAGVRFEVVFPVFYDGAYHASDGLPRSYVPAMLLRTTPLPVLALAALGVVAALRRVRRAPRSRRSAFAVVISLWIGMPLAGAAVLRPNVYDGIRHFLFVLPAIALLAALGATSVVRWLARRARAIPRGLLLAGVAAVLASPLVAVARLHPYEYVFYNSFAGGLRGAESRFETDYFATAHREAMQWVNAKAALEPARRFRVLVGGTEPMTCATVHAGANVDVEVVRPDGGHPSRLPPGADFYVGTMRYHLSQRPFEDSPVVHRIERDGATLCVVRTR